MAKLAAQLPVLIRPIDWLLSPIQQFLRIQAAGGILLLLATVAALVWANVWGDGYYQFWHKPVVLSVGAAAHPLLNLNIDSWAHVVNDGLMVIFFFVVGLEIKREMLVGELASIRKAAVPIAAAIGGIAVPAIIFAAITAGSETLRGWAIPCATDIAFALGVMAMLGKRVPVQLKVFLMALAIVDDIGAVLIIALFYTSELSISAMAIAGGTMVLLIVCNVLHVRRGIVYIVLGFILWVAVLESGVHATVAGVLLAFTIPAKFRIQGADFVRFSRQAIDKYEAAGGNENDSMTNPERQRWVFGLESACEHVQTPLLRMENSLHPFSSFLIVPIFALANAGIRFGPEMKASLDGRMALVWGIALGLVIGKQVGITLFAWVATRLGFGLPEGTTWKQIYAASWLAGIGFTMSLFIANLGFAGVADSEATITAAKVGVLGGSLIAGIVGFVLLRAFTSLPSSPAPLP